MAREKHSLRGMKTPDTYEVGVMEESNFLLYSLKFLGACKLNWQNISEKKERVNLCV